MTQEEFRKKVLALTETEQKLKNGDYPLAKFDRQVLWGAQKDEHGYYYFSNRKMTLFPANYELRFPISYSTSGNNLRLLIHTRFTKTPFHYNEFISVNYVYSGRLKLQFTEHEMILTKGQLVFMNSDVIHSFEMDSENDIVFGIQIQKDYMKKELLYDISGGGSVTDFLLKSILGEDTDFTYHIFNFSDDVRMHFLFEELFCEYLEPSLCGHAMVENYMRIFFILLVRASNENINDPYDNKIISILEYIEAHSRRCTLKELSGRFNFNQKYISALLKKKTGKTFSELLTQAKMKTICHLLENTDKPVREIAEMCGYSNQTFFYQKFMKLYHMTPKEYRSSRKQLHSFQ